MEAESGVSAQPFGMEETRLGALNRLKAARASAALRNLLTWKMRMEMSGIVSVCDVYLSY